MLNDELKAYLKINLTNCKISIKEIEISIR